MVKNAIVVLSLSAVVLVSGLTSQQLSPRYPVTAEDQRSVDRFHQIWYDNPGTWMANKWLGIITLQNPMDAWVTQEILFEAQPDYFVECGAMYGGSAALWATMLEQINPTSRVISIDIEDRFAEARRLPIVQRRVEFLIGSSTDPKMVASVAAKVKGKKVVVLLDSDHSKRHVLDEMKAYSPLINVGSYLIVQDSNINGHPANPTFGPGPMEAIDEFLAGTKDFVIDRSRERLLFTFNPRGFLKRVQ